VTDTDTDTSVADREPVLRRRLGALAATTTFDEQAWDRIQHRIATRKRPGRARPSPRWLVAAAAAMLVLLGAVLLTRGEDGGRVETDDTEDTTTTTGRRTTSTTDPGRATSTSTTRPGDAPEVPRDRGPAGGASDGSSGGGAAPDVGAAPSPRAEATR
jgi:hypothetical protein